MGDDGVGVHAAMTLCREGGLAGAEILEVGTAILDALPAIEAADRIVVMDAVCAGDSSGDRLPDSAFTVCREQLHCLCTWAEPGSDTDPIRQTGSRWGGSGGGAGSYRLVDVAFSVCGKSASKTPGSGNGMKCR